MSFSSRMKYIGGQLPRGVLRLIAQGGRPGAWIMHQLGWLKWVDDTLVHDHGINCSGPDIEFILRPNGYYHLCRGCDIPVKIHFSYWEREDGMMPDEIVKWIAEVVELIQEAEDGPVV